MTYRAAGPDLLQIDLIVRALTLGSGLALAIVLYGMGPAFDVYGTREIFAFRASGLHFFH